MSGDSSETILAAQECGVLTLTINRPRQKNALDPSMYAALRQHLDRAAEDTEIRAVLLQGGDGIFCAGNDVKAFDSVRELPWNERPGYQFMTTLARFPKPVVAAVTGDAIGIGLTLLLHCDLVYAAEQARFGSPFVELGLVPEFAATLLIPRLFGHVKAAELLLLGERLTAEQAQALGLINAVLQSQALLAVARQAAQRLAHAPSQAIQATKRLLRAPLLAATLATLDTEMQEFWRLFDGPEARARLSALAARRADRHTSMK